MRATDGYAASNISATTAEFHLDGGQYGMTMVVGGGTVQLQRKGPDGSTYVPVGSSATSGTTLYQTVSVPNGGYKIACSSTPTGIYAELIRIPGE